MERREFSETGCAYGRSRRIRKPDEPQEQRHPADCQTHAGQDRRASCRSLALVAWW